MGYPTKVQLINRRNNDRQFYVNFPFALAQAIELQKGEIVEWSIKDQFTLTLKRSGSAKINSQKKKTT